MIGNNRHIDASTSKRWVRKSANPLFFVNNSEHRSLLTYPVPYDLTRPSPREGSTLLTPSKGSRYILSQ